jgi:hypothetical protein
VLLEPMDLVTLTDSNLGLNLTTVRLTEVDENEDGTFMLHRGGMAIRRRDRGRVRLQLHLPDAEDFPLEAPKMPASSGLRRVRPAILNLTGNETTRRSIYVIRTDRLPTLGDSSRHDRRFGITVTSPRGDMRSAPARTRRRSHSQPIIRIRPR